MISSEFLKSKLGVTAQVLGIIISILTIYGLVKSDDNTSCYDPNTLIRITSDPDQKNKAIEINELLLKTGCFTERRENEYFCERSRIGVSHIDNMEFAKWIKKETKELEFFVIEDSTKHQDKRDVTLCIE